MSISFQLDEIKASWSSRSDFELYVPTLHFAIDDTSSDSVGNMLPIVGRSGGGKSTLLYILALLKIPDCGNWQYTSTEKNYLWSNQQKISKGEMRRLRCDEFGFAYQSSTLTEPLTVGENLCYPLWLNGYSSVKAKERALNALKRVRIDSDPPLDEFFMRYPHTLSGGTQQRVALAQAWIHNPNVFFADEPTGSLDIQTRLEIMEKVCEWLDASSDRLFVWVTHHERALELEQITHCIVVKDRQAKLICKEDYEPCR